MAARLLAMLAVVVVAHGKQVVQPASSYFNICPRGDSKALEECVKKIIIDLKPQLRKGIPALGVISLEPLEIPKMELNEGGAFVLDTTMTDVHLLGLGDYALNSVNMKLEKDSLMVNISVTVPDLHIFGDYQMDGRILLLPIAGNGNFEMNITNMIIELNFASKAVNRNGKRYFEIVDVKCNLILKGKSWSWFHNLFNGQKVLGDATNAFLNNNYKETHEATKHLPEGAFAQLYKEIVSKIFNLYSIDELFAN